jgi:prolyl oligopeptidase
MAVDLEHRAKENWREVIPHSPDAVVRNVVPAGHRLLVTRLHNVSMQVSVHEPDGKKVRDVPLPTLGSVYFWPGATWDSNEVFYGFDSLARPMTMYRYDLATEKQTVWWRWQVPFDVDAVTMSQVWYTSKDGTRVPMFVVAKKSLKRDGNRPVLLSGYGGYGAVANPFYNQMAAVWVENGGVYAFARHSGRRRVR